MEELTVQLQRERDGGGERFRPEPSLSLEEAGVTESMVEKLVLKNLYFRGEVSGRHCRQRGNIPMYVRFRVTSLVRIFIMSTPET